MELEAPGGSKVHTDSTGRLIIVGDRVRFRGQEYTIRDFGSEIGRYEGAVDIIFEEPRHTQEIPTETTVDKIR